MVARALVLLGDMEALAKRCPGVLALDLRCLERAADEEAP
jgi:hypothetical protein